MTARRKAHALDDAIRELLAAGVGGREIARRLGRSWPTVHYRIKTLGKAGDYDHYRVPAAGPRPYVYRPRPGRRWEPRWHRGPKPKPPRPVYRVETLEAALARGVTITRCPPRFAAPVAGR